MKPPERVLLASLLPLTIGDTFITPLDDCEHADIHSGDLTVCRVYGLTKSGAKDGAEQIVAAIASATTLAAERDRLKAALCGMLDAVSALSDDARQEFGGEDDAPVILANAALTGTGPSPYDALKAENAELLGALEEMVIANHGLPICPQEEKEPVCAKALERARAAIRKAQGGVGA